MPVLQGEISKVQPLFLRRFWSHFHSNICQLGRVRFRRSNLFSRGVFGDIFIAILEKVTRFTGFWMGSPSLSTVCSSPKHFTLEKLYSFSYYLYAGGWNLPYFVSIFWLPLQIPSSLWPPSSGTLQLGSPTPPDPFPFSGAQPVRPTSMTFFWETPYVP